MKDRRGACLSSKKTVGMHIVPSKSKKEACGESCGRRQSRGEQISKADGTSRDRTPPTPPAIIL